MIARLPIFESAMMASSTRVDREARVIRRVKVLGSTSDNGRRYTPEAVHAAVGLYEGVSVRVNHPRKATDQRDSADVFGWLSNVVAEEGDIYADLHYLESHPLAERVIEAAERNPRLFGLSHNADGEGKRVNGVLVVSQICEVRSVDLVADPATTQGLFESKAHTGGKMKLRAFFEAVKTRLAGKKKTALARLLEADDSMLPPSGEVEADPMASSNDPNDLLRQGFKAACQAVLDDDTLDMQGKLAKLKEIMKAEEKLLNSGAPTEPTEPPADDDMGDDDMGSEDDLTECDDMDDEKKPMKESKTVAQLRRRVRELESESKVHQLCESMAIVPSKPLVKALVALTEEEDRRALLKEVKAMRGRPRTQQQTTAAANDTGGGTETFTPTDAKTLVASLRSGRFTRYNEE